MGSGSERSVGEDRVSGSRLPIRHGDVELVEGLSQCELPRLGLQHERARPSGNRRDSR